jgi:hypothetical protein
VAWYPSLTVAASFKFKPEARRPRLGPGRRASLRPRPSGTGGLAQSESLAGIMMVDSGGTGTAII